MLCDLHKNKVGRKRHKLINKAYLSTIHKSNAQSGVTLIELTFSIVIISIALTGILTVINQTVSHSADPLIQHQAIAIAESYLEEILLQSFDDPDGIDGETSRHLFDDVDDYNGLSDTGVKDHQGHSVTSLSNYNVSVVVSDVTLVDSVLAKKINVNVSAGSTSLDLVGYRANI